MDLAQKLKAARLEAGLSQRQLCGDVITRNMLSQIENGSAHPSMNTLRYLAGQLQKPVSYFLEEQAVVLPNQACIEQARLAFAQGDAQGTREALASFQEPDELLQEESILLWYLSGLQLAQQALNQNRQPYAVALLQQLETVDGLYITSQLEQQRLLLLATAGEPVTLPDQDALLLLRAEAALRRSDGFRAEELLAAVEDRTVPYWALLKGHALFLQQDYGQAARFYHRAEEAYPRITTPRLEICYRELGDYKRAYEYAKK